MGTIYGIWNEDTGKVYVGSAVDFRRRRNEHLSGLKNNKHGNKYLQNAWNKYGEENFLFYIIEEVEDDNSLIEREQFWLDMHDSANRLFGYNICPTTSSCLGITRTEEFKQKVSNANMGKTYLIETIRKMSESKRGKYLGENNPFYGKTHTLEFKDRLSKIHTGRKISEETRLRLSIATSGKNNPMYGVSRFGEDNPMYGKQHSDATKKRLSVSRSLDWIVTSPDGIECLITNLSKFCNENNLNSSCMGAVSRGKQSHHKGWECRKVEDKDGE